MTDPSASSDVTRRAVVRGAALGGVALPLLAACGGGGSSSDGSGGAGGSGGSGGGTKSGSSLVRAADVPVGGGKILADQQVVVTQPAKGEFKAFTAVCTHQGCLVAQVAQGNIVCPCHGSTFSIKDGSVTGGPAPSPLAAVKIEVKGGEVSKA